MTFMGYGITNHMPGMAVLDPKPSASETDSEAPKPNRKPSQVNASTNMNHDGETTAGAAGLLRLR